MPGRKTLGDAGKVKSLLEAVQKYKNFKQMAQFNVVSLKARGYRHTSPHLLGSPPSASSTSTLPHDAHAITKHQRPFCAPATLTYRPIDRH